jgi:hypothetical protein
MYHYLKGLWFFPLLCVDVHLPHVFCGSFFANVSRITIHLHTHAHLVFNGKCRESFEEMKNMVAKKALRIPNVTSFVIALATNKTFFSPHLFNEDGQGTIELLKGDKFHEISLKFILLCSPNIHNIISSVKHRLKKVGFVIPS